MTINIEEVHVTNLSSKEQRKINEIIVEGNIANPIIQNEGQNVRIHIINYQNGYHQSFFNKEFLDIISALHNKFI